MIFKNDLRILVMLLLPIAHVLFLVGSFLAATVVNCLGFIGYATASIYEILGRKYKLLDNFLDILNCVCIITQLYKLGNVHLRKTQPNVEHQGFCYTSLDFIKDKPESFKENLIPNFGLEKVIEKFSFSSTKQ